MTGSRLVDLSDLPVVDGHCHPLLADPGAVSSERFASLFSEGRPGTMAAHIPHTGYFRRALRDLAERLGTEATVEAVLERRRQLGAEAASRAVTDGGVAALLVDTGYPPDAMPLGRMRSVLPCAIHEVFRIETCAQALLPQALPYAEFLDAFRAELRAAAGRAVAFKSIIAYRSGLAIRPWTPEEAAAAYRDVIARVQSGGSARLTEKPLLDTLVNVALEVCKETGRPLQLHSGFGDPDVDLLQSNPLLLRPVLEDPRWADVRIVVLHMAYPYFREAAFMAAVWPQLHVDLSLALPFLGAGAVLPLREMLSLAPSSKLLYGSDVGALPELFALSAEWARASLGEALGWLIARDGWSGEDARRVARQIFSDNATSLYRLPA
jgi:predicted TIM-barrel fold metal-dependent hydrolase